MIEENLKLENKDLPREAAYIEKAKSYIEQGRYDKATEELNKALQINPHNEEIYFEMGNIGLRMNDDVYAQTQYRKALDINPHFFYASLELGKLHHYRMKRVDLAIKEFECAVKESPSHWEAYYELGIIYKERGECNYAIKYLQKASELNQEAERAHFEIGKLYRDMDNPDEAIKEFEKVLEIKDNRNDTFIRNKVLNEIEITQKKIVLESKVRAMVAMIINKCNLSCIICHIWKSSWQASAKTMNEIVRLFPYMEDIAWEGGEVLLMKGFDDVMKEASRYKHLKQVLFTNGLTLNEKVIERIINGKVDIVFSIDGVTKETYEYIRKGGKFEHLIKNLKLIKQAKEASAGKIAIYFNSIIMKSNYLEVEKFIDFAKEYNFNAVTLTPIRGCFRQENIFEDNDAVALGYLQKVMPKVTKKAADYGIILNNWIPGIRVTNEGQENSDIKNEKETNCRNSGAQQKNRMICYAPWQRLVLDSEGQVRPFVFCLNKWIGNTDKNSLEEIWNGEAMQEYRRRILQHDYVGLCQPECISGQVADKIRDIT